MDYMTGGRARRIIAREIITKYKVIAGARQGRVILNTRTGGSQGLPRMVESYHFS